MIARCLEYNKSLLNCLDGLPLRDDVAQQLLDHDDIQPNIKDKKVFTPVMSASIKGRTNALKVINKMKKDDSFDK